jgi:NADH dehydrogenase
MTSSETHLVTGAFGYSGRIITSRLLEAGYRVRTLTHTLHRENPFGDRVEVHPFNFDYPDGLAASLKGVSVLYNTYWVRFPWGGSDHATAVRNTLALFVAARRAGVRRIVHTSITNPSADSRLPYFRGKALLERALIESGISYAILRPAVFFGHEDILINNIAWALRHLPIFGVFGNGRYRLQPIHVDDFARLAVAQGQSRANVVIDAIGPETFTYLDLVVTLASILGVRRPVFLLPPRLGYAAAWAIGKMMGDILLTWDEVQGLMANLLATPSPPAGTTRLTGWARQHASTLGLRYASELARRKNHLSLL